MTCEEVGPGRARSGPPYILVIDDESAFRDVLGHVLADEGYVVRTAGDGLEGLTIARREVPDLVLLDLMMPRVSGHEVLASMARDRALSSVPVLVLSGSPPDDARRSGANVVGCIKKPVNLEALLQKLASILG